MTPQSMLATKTFVVRHCLCALEMLLIEAYLLQQLKEKKTVMASLKVY